MHQIKGSVSLAALTNCLPLSICLPLLKITLSIPRISLLPLTKPTHLCPSSLSLFPHTNPHLSIPHLSLFFCANPLLLVPHLSLFPRANLLSQSHISLSLCILNLYKAICQKPLYFALYKLHTECQLPKAECQCTLQALNC